MNTIGSQQRNFQAAAPVLLALILAGCGGGGEGGGGDPAQAPVVMATGFYAGPTQPDSGRPMLLLDGAGLAAAAGLRFEKAVRVEAADTVAAPGMAA